MKTAIATMLILTLLAAAPSHADDWPMLGRDNTRNGVSTETNPPTLWRVVDTTDKEHRLLPRNRMSGNIKWSVQLGSQTGGDLARKRSKGWRSGLGDDREQRHFHSRS